mmetsp:Transcript_36649/g.95984  ORF Transcript_36649/g.95984 Transcript_36649/m.95984 type:complete len:274 (+) Transcript_36649:112-933(+)
MALLMYPFGFHPGAMRGCTRPSSSVARARMRKAPAEGSTTFLVHFCHAHLLTGSLSESTSAHVMPWSYETSTAVTFPAPLHARPSTATVVESVVWHRGGAVMMARTPSLVMISVSIGGLYWSGGVVVLAAPANIGSTGILYAHPVILAPSCTWSRTQIRLSHLPCAAPGYPGANTRSGQPWYAGSGCPFISITSMVPGSSAFSSEKPREMRSVSLPAQSLSSAYHPMYEAFFARPTDCRTSRRRIPVQLPLPAAPMVHWLPDAGPPCARLPGR